MAVTGMTAALAAWMRKLTNASPAVAADNSFFSCRNEPVAHDAADRKDEVHRCAVRSLDYYPGASLRPAPRSSALHITPSSGF